MDNLATRGTLTRELSQLVTRVQAEASSLVSSSLIVAVERRISLFSVVAGEGTFEQPRLIYEIKENRREERKSSRIIAKSFIRVPR